MSPINWHPIRVFVFIKLQMSQRFGWDVMKAVEEELVERPRIELGETAILQGSPGTHTRAPLVDLVELESTTPALPRQCSCR
jgi:hypothetical protein